MGALRKGEDLVVAVGVVGTEGSERDQVAFEESSSGLLELVPGQGEGSGDGLLAVPTHAVGAGGQDEEDVDGEVLQRELGEEAVSAEAMVDPAEAVGNAADEVGARDDARHGVLHGAS